MASSSEWLGALADGQVTTSRNEPQWLELVSGSSEFCELLPGRTEALTSGADESAGGAEQEKEEERQSVNALEEAFAKGHEAGYAAASAELECEAVLRRGLRLAFRSLDEAALDVLAQELADTVMKLCDEVLADRAGDDASLLSRCREAATRMGSAPDRLRLLLHPDDIARIGPEPLREWTVVAESAVEPGGLLLEGPDGAVRDGPADWRRAIAAAVRA